MEMFKGERMNHNSERIYGIDLSKHQHEKGTKHYNIEWAKLRITDLGKISTKQITGQVNYPIAFVYIKSTEGRTVLNPYYRNDYLQAHKHGIRVGTYHSFLQHRQAQNKLDIFCNIAFLQKETCLQCSM